MRILNLDIETRPATAYIWDLKTRYVPPGNIIEPKRMLCFAAKWVGEPRVTFMSNWHDGQFKMVTKIDQLISQADVVLHYNGRRFDMPHIRTEIALAGLTPPPPVQQIDLFRAAKSAFALMSFKLDEVSKLFGTSRKLDHEGMGLWIKVLAGDIDARKRMRLYNIDDIYANESLYEFLLPWIPSHPSRGIVDGQAAVCSACGSADLERRGYAYTSVCSYRRFRCKQCGKWLRESRRLASSELREVAG